MKLWIAILLGISVSLFVLWPIFLAGTEHAKIPKKIKNDPNRKLAGCIPIYKGSILLLSSRKKHKLTLPKGGVDDGEEMYYAAGRETVEEMGIIGKIDTVPIVKEAGVEWFILEVTHILDEWKERHERIRKLMTIESALLNSEVRAMAKIVIKAALKEELKKKNPRLNKESFVL
ncbi:diphosphoinositol-polyphosphate diphosphatase [Nematocida sp. LUAm3]|nr:diphosphoinositol-polyphosphate diphosphatase [Nematocida sp. LUAm3]KAI5175233.1 diphosphoinositol-polyphosphate diphosphatase [Nematocida sp. LUAm2]KAI5178095.1 diphosphoinositol-polyphosphate diphosphatase [Nematocida sp. LUAm1]